jgi:ribosomal protein L11 methyltransferase
VAPPSRTWPAVDLRARGDRALPSGFADTLALVLDDLDPTAVEDDDSACQWRVHFGDALSRDAALPHLRHAVGTWLDVTAVEIPDEGWATRAQQDLRAVRVDGLLVAPPWDVPAPCPSSADVVIVIEPSMGFGTGHHQSTRLCLRLLQEVPVAGARVIDVGTGSGVLALAARRLGAADVQGIDNDPDSIDAARANLARNGSDPAVRVDQADLADASLAPASLVVANLTAWLLRRHREPLAALVAPGGRLLTSGFTSDQLPLVLESFPAFRVDVMREEDSWLGLVLLRA